MTYKKNVLVVANVTAGSESLCRELTERAKREPASFDLLVPATGAGGGRAAAEQTLSSAVSRLREVGLEATGSVGDADPIIAVTEAWDPRRYDEIIVSTLPIGSSKWLHGGLPERIYKITGVPVTHIVSEPPKPTVAPVHLETDDNGKLLGPLTVLGWGKPHGEAEGAP
jgi:hypothetical protein